MKIVYVDLDAAETTGFLDKVGDGVGRAFVELLFGASKVEDEVEGDNDDVVDEEGGEAEVPLHPTCSNCKHSDLDDNTSPCSKCVEFEKYEPKDATDAVMKAAKLKDHEVNR